MTTPPATEPTPDDLCCGERGPETVRGKPRVVACQLCPRSLSYWRLPENRDDGKLYEPVAPLSEASG